jgi:putative DNA primase/helicase
MPLNEFDLARAALACIPYKDREQWVRIGMALKGSLGDAGRPLFEEFTERSSESRKKDLASSWRSFREGGKVTIGSLVYEAKEHGFEPGQTSISKTTWEELRAAKQRQKQRAKEEAAKRAAGAAAAADRAIVRWRRAEREGQCEYLGRKKITAEAVRFDPASGSMLIPMIRYDRPREQALVAIQTIFPAGSKNDAGEELGKVFTKDAEKAGAALRLGPAVLDPLAPIAIAEGYATARSVRMATGDRWTVFVAFDAGNLLPVARIVRKLYPENWILFAADDDFLTAGNPGRTKALMAARRIRNADVACPVFDGRGSRKLTDWNDLHVEQGLDEVALQITRIIANVKRYSARRIAA